MKGLTEKQKNILEFIEDFMDVNMMAPTVYEIAEHFGIKTSTVFAHVRSLQKKNFLTRSSKARSISLKHPQRKNRRPAGLRSVPLFDSPADAGSRRNRNSEIFYDSSMLKDSKDLRKLFAVRIGDSLDFSGMVNGDIIILKRSPDSLKSGDIVLVKVNGIPELRTCKVSESGEIELIGKTDETPSLLFRNSPVEGVVVGLQRTI